MTMYRPQFFTLDELTTTDCRYHRNIPNFEQVENLSCLCEFLLDPLRKMVDTPIVVNSGFRDPEVNRIVNGVKNSYHLKGMAADIWSHTYKPKELFDIIKNNFVFTELGLYYSFVHVAYDPNHLTMDTFVKL